MDYSPKNIERFGKIPKETQKQQTSKGTLAYALSFMPTIASLNVITPVLYILQ